MKLFPLLSASLLLWAGCQPQPAAHTGTDRTSTAATAIGARPQLRSPLDTFAAFINNGYEFPQDMVSAHFAVDSFYFTPNTTFKGVSLYQPANRSYACVVLQYDDGMVCSSQWLFTLDTASLKGIAQLEVESNCDADLSRDYYFMHYRKDNDTLLHTVTLHYGPGDHQPLLDSTVARYMLLPDGRIAGK